MPSMLDFADGGVHWAWSVHSTFSDWGLVSGGTPSGVEQLETGICASFVWLINRWTSSRTKTKQLPCFWDWWLFKGDYWCISHLNIYIYMWCFFMSDLYTDNLFQLAVVCICWAVICYPNYPLPPPLRFFSFLFFSVQFDYTDNHCDWFSLQQIRAANLMHCSFLAAFASGDASPINVKQRHAVSRQ